MQNIYKSWLFFPFLKFEFLKSSQPGSKSQNLNTLNSQAYVVPFKAAAVNEAFSGSMAGKLNHNPTATPQWT